MSPDSQLLKDIKQVTAAQVKAFMATPASDPLNALAYVGLLFVDAVIDELIKEARE